MKTIAKQPKGIEYYMRLPYSILLHEVEEEGEKYWIAEIPELPGCKSHGSTVEETVKSVEEAKKDWILDGLKSGEEVPTPVERETYSGRMVVRMSPSLHRSLALTAKAERSSLNQLIVTILAREVGGLSVLSCVQDRVDVLLCRIDNVLERESVWTLPSKSLPVPGEAVDRALEIIVQQAVAAQASDMQIAPENGRLRIQFRIENTFTDAMSLPPAAAALLIARIKVLANLDVADRGPQEGVFRLRGRAINQHIDCKVTISSTAYGEMATLHLATEVSPGTGADIEKQVTAWLSKIA